MILGQLFSGNDYVYTVKRNDSVILEESEPGDSTLRRFVLCEKASVYHNKVRF